MILEVVAVVAVVNVAAGVAGLFGHRRTEQRLAKPWLGGVPLPAVDDPRWRRASATWAQLGAFQVYVYRLEPGTVRLDGHLLGVWPAYGEAVRRRLAAAAAEAPGDLFERALHEIEHAE